MSRLEKESCNGSFGSHVRYRRATPPRLRMAIPFFTAALVAVALTRPLCQSSSPTWSTTSKAGCVCESRSSWATPALLTR
jgi:hypothetical protein